MSFSLLMLFWHTGLKGFSLCSMIFTSGKLKGEHCLFQVRKDDISKVQGLSFQFLYFIKFKWKSWLKLVNYFILQWFCIRLCKMIENKMIVGWGFMLGVVPTTGWTLDYKFLFGMTKAKTLVFWRKK